MCFGLMAFEERGVYSCLYFGDAVSPLAADLEQSRGPAGQLRGQDCAVVYGGGCR